MALPYYLAAFLFAVFLAKKARQSEALTIPDRLAEAYGDRTAAVGALVIFVMTVPAAYVLMLGTIGEQLFGWPFWVGVVLGTILPASISTWAGSDRSSGPTSFSSS